MKLRKNLLRKSRLYLILNRRNNSDRFLKKICSGLCGGIDIIQLRDKVNTESDILNFSLGLSKKLSASKTLFIINDYVYVALASQADGVHLGQADASIKEARKILGKGRIIGVSCHSLKQALKAQREGADYIGIGPVYATPTKPEYKAIGLKSLRQLSNRIKIPYFAIGGIDQGNVKDIISSGASRIAVARAILEAKEPKKSAKQLFRLLGKE